MRAGTCSFYESFERWLFLTACFTSYDNRAVCLTFVFIKEVPHVSVTL